MKWFVYLLSFYMLVLFEVPCADIADSDHIDTHEIEATDGHTHDDTDHCSPFCHCACCGVSITTFVFDHPGIECTAADFELKDVLVQRIPVFISNYFEDIWQPPQLRTVLV